MKPAYHPSPTSNTPPTDPFRPISPLPLSSLPPQKRPRAPYVVLPPPPPPAHSPLPPAQFSPPIQFPPPAQFPPSPTSAFPTHLLNPSPPSTSPPVDWSVHIAPVLPGPALRPTTFTSHGPCPPPPQRHACSHCPATFGQRSNLNKHIFTVHLNHRPHACPHCDAAFGERGHLGTHVKNVHQKARPNECDDCGAAFGERWILMRHIRAVHKQERPFVCRVSNCQAAFSDRSNLNRHARLIHGKSKGKKVPSKKGAVEKIGKVAPAAAIEA